MNLLSSDRFSLVKRWEGDINPPSFIVPDATGSTLIVGRDLRLKKKCSIRVELTLMPPLPSLMLSPTTCCWSSLHPIKTLVVHSELKSSTPPTLASVSGCVIVTFSIITESKHSNVLSNSVLKGYLFNSVLSLLINICNVFTNPILGMESALLGNTNWQGAFQPAALGCLAPAADSPIVTSTHKVVSSGLFILYNAPCFNPLVVRSIPHILNREP